MPHYTKKQRASLAKAFKAAKSFLYKGPPYTSRDKTAHICFAIEHACHVGRLTVDESELSRAHIRLLLGNNGTVSGWLRDHLDVQESERTSENVQQFRHRWLDALIKEFST